MLHFTFFRRLFRRKFTIQIFNRNSLNSYNFSSELKRFLFDFGKLRGIFCCGNIFFQYFFYIRSISLTNY